MTDEQLYAQIREAIGHTRPCSACGTDHPITDFAFKSKAALKLHGRCRASKRRYDSQWYVANGDHHRANVKERRARLVEEVNAMVDEAIAGRACRCGSTERMTVVAANGRSFKVLVKQGWSLPDLRDALPNATVRCGRCARSTR